MCSRFLLLAKTLGKVSRCFVTISSCCKRSVLLIFSQKTNMHEWKVADGSYAY